MWLCRDREVCNIHAHTVSAYVKTHGEKEKENSKIRIASDFGFTLGVFWYGILK